MTIDYNLKTFVAIGNSSNGQVSEEVVFHYFQKDNIVWGNYEGGVIKKGSLVGICNKNATLNFVYQHIDIHNHLKTGKCISMPEILPDGKIRLYEKWQWSCDDYSEGTSIVEEVILQKPAL